MRMTRTRQTPTMKKFALAIAKDVLKHLKARKIIATRGHYFQLTSRRSYAVLEKGGDLQKILKKVPKCEVCAIGAAFVAQTLKYDKVEQQTHTLRIDDNVMRDKLNTAFTDDQLFALENVFERISSNQGESATVALKNIFQSIVKAKGGANHFQKEVNLAEEAQDKERQW